jgi:hypothetical protein
MTTRCSCLATTTQRICKHKFTFILLGKRYCTHHAKVVFNKEATYIQSVWRARAVRHKMKNIFLRLDEDMQRKIIWHMREQHFIEKHHHAPIRKILTKRVRELFNVSETGNWATGTLYFEKSVPSQADYRRQQYYSEATTLYNLYSKYASIADDDYCHMLYSIQRNLIIACRNSVQGNNMRNLGGGLVDENDAGLTYTQLYDSITEWAELQTVIYGSSRQIVYAY